MEKKYKLKEECKKYFDLDEVDRRMTKKEWYELNISDEALEEIVEKETLFTADGERTIMKNSAIQWTKKEIELVEFVINEFESVKDIDIKFKKYHESFIDRRGCIRDFTDWLKQR